MQRYYADYPHLIDKKERKGSSKAQNSGKKALCIVTATVFLLSLALLLFAIRALPEGNRSVPSTEWHFVIMYEREEAVSAQVAAQDARERGGAGFVINDGIYRIAAAVYKSKTDATAVAGKIDGACVYTVKAPGLRLPDLGDSTDEALSAFGAYKSSYGEILKVVEDLERGSAVESVVTYTLTRESRALVGVRENMQALEEKQPCAELNALCDYLDFAVSELAAAEKSEDGTVSSRARSALCSLVYNYAVTMQALSD